MFKVWVKVENEWATNALVFETREEADRYGYSLLMRWFVPTDYEIRPVEGEE